MLLNLSPRGALTSKPYAFKIRAWELSSLETIDFNDHFNSSIYVQYKNSKIVRILPKKVKNSISIISDVSRFSFDSLQFNRPTTTLNLTQQYKKSFRDYNLKSIILVSNTADLVASTIFRFFDLNNKKKIIRRETFSLRSHLLIWNSFNLFKQFELVSKICFISSNIVSVESTLLNVKIRLKFNKKHFHIFYCGYFINSNYSLKFLSLKLKPFFLLLKSKSLISFYFFKTFKFLTFIVSESLVRRFTDLVTLLNFFKQKIKTCLFYFLTKQKNYFTTQIIPIKNINTRILKRINKIFLGDLDDSFQTTKILKLNPTNQQLIAFASFNVPICLRTKFLFPVSSCLESTKLFINFEQKINKSNKFPGVTNENFGLSLIKCFSFFKFVRLALVNYKLIFKTIFSSSFSRIIFENFKIFSLLGDFNIFFQTIKSNLNYFLSNSYPDKVCFEDRFRYSLSTKNSLTMLNCSRSERKQASNF